MRKAILHIFFLSLLFHIGVTQAFALPHDAVAATAVHKQTHESKWIAIGEEGNLQYSKEITLTDWEDFDECDHEDRTTSLEENNFLAAISSVKENLLAVSHTHQLVWGKIYATLNCSRLPRHNYISLRVLRI